MEYRVRFLPNWRPEHSPVWVDITSCLTGSTPKITKGIQRREAPFSLVYGDLGLTLNNTDRRFDDLFSLDKIMGTDPTDYRAPLIHYGKILIARREYGNTNWQPLLYFVEPKSVKFAPEIGQVAINCYSPGKLLEVGNAERVHRFSATVGPAPWVLVGYDLTTPETPPGGTSPDPAWFRLDGGASLPIMKGDRFKAVESMVAVTEGQETIDLAGVDLTVAQAIADGSDLLIEAYDEDGNPADGVLIAAGDGLFEHLNPWWRNRRLSDLIDLLVGEVNDAMAAANYIDTLTVVQDAFDGALGSSVLDLIDGTGLPVPATGAGWFKDGTGRALAVGGDQGYIKADILAPAASVDRSLPAWDKTTAVAFAGKSPDYGRPRTYPDPMVPLPASSPPPDLDKAPIVGQARHFVQNLGFDFPLTWRVMSTYWHVTPASYTSAVGATKYAYRIEACELAFTRFYPGSMQQLITYRRRTVITLYTTTDEGQTWTQSSTNTVNGDSLAGGAVVEMLSDDTGDALYYFAPSDQPWVGSYDVGGGDTLYLIFYPQHRKAYWRKNNTASLATSNLIPSAGGIAEIGTTLRPGYRSGAITDGTDIFMFLDSTEEYRTAGAGTVTVTNGSTTVTGAGTSFTTTVAAGDTLEDVLGGTFGKYTVASVTNNTTLVLATAIQEATAAGASYVIGKTGALAMYYWNGTTMAAGTLAGFPSGLSGADFQGATFDPGRGKLYIFNHGGFYDITYSYSGGTLTADAYTFVPVDTPSNDPRQDLGALTVGGTVDRAARQAWFAGPVDVDQGTPAVDYAAAVDALLVITEMVPYIYSSNYGGIIRIADFSGLSSSTAIEKLIQIPQQVQDSGCDLDTITDPDAYEPDPTVRLTKRIVTSGTPLDVIDLTLSARSELWICQYTDVRVQNSAGDQVPEVRNDLSFTLDGQQYTVIAARYGGVNSLKIDNPFISTRSLAKLMANAYAYEFLIPRFSGPVKIIDPFAITDGTTIIAPQSRVEYLKRAPDGFTGPETAVGKVIKISYSLDDNTLDIEVA